MKSTTTLYDRVIIKLKSNKLVVIILILFAILVGIKTLFPSFLSPRQKKVKIVPELPNINAKAVIDKIEDSTFFYHFEISNISNVVARNILVATSDGDVYRNTFSSPIKIDLTPNSKMRETGSIIPTPIKPIISIYLIVKYTTFDDSVRNCLFRFFIQKGEFGVKEYEYDLKNCENHPPSRDRVALLIQNVRNN